MGSLLGLTLAIMSLCAIFKTSGWKTVVLFSNELLIDHSLMMHFYSFEQMIMMKSLKIMSKNNIKT